MNLRLNTVIVKISKVRFTASYCKIAMKPSSPEMWTSLDYGLKQVIFTSSSKQVGGKKKKKVKRLSHTELSRYCKKQIWGITTRSIYMHSINVTHPKRTHFSSFISDHDSFQKYLLPLPLQASYFGASPNLLALHKTPTRSYPVCQQALRDMNSSQILNERNWMPFSDGCILTRIWWPYLHQNGVS